jgi:DNA-binding GntR family transcriptional regulator
MAGRAAPRPEERSKSASHSPVIARPPEPRRLLPGRIVTRLRAEIVAGEWSPGERITEQALCKRYGVSRTPLREALKILETQGLLALLPNRGAVIAEPTLEDTVEKLRVMGALEALAAVIACEQASAKAMAALERLHGQMMAAHAARDAARYFALNGRAHRAIVLAAGNRTLAALHESLSRQVELARHLANFRESLSDESKQEHEAIIAALLRRDGAAAQEAVERHIATVLRKIRATRPDGPCGAGNDVAAIDR